MEFSWKMRQKQQKESGLIVPKYREVFVLMN